ncbi:MAG TPA: acyl carrier protein [Crenalkalicoccus sp.]|nr:acyl carrier protein [Crenalkalicoccus sp.]
MTEAEILQGLEAIFAELFLRDDIRLTPATTAANVEGWDSFRQVEILMAAEARFGVRFSAREMDRLANVGDLVAVIARRVSDR